MKMTKKDKMQLYVRRIFLFISDIILINIAVFISLIMRFSMSVSAIEPIYINHFKSFIIPYTFVTLVIFWVFRMYHSLWQYASITEVYKIVEACVVVEVVHFIMTSKFNLKLPISCYTMSAMCLIYLLGISRFMYRILRTTIQNYRQTNIIYRIMIIGAGEATNIIMREIAASKYLDDSKVLCIIDDDNHKVGKSIRGVKVVGSRFQIKEYVSYYNINQIIFAIPSASIETRKAILNICKETNCELKILPGIYQLVDGEIDINAIRNVDVLDLLGRDSIDVDLGSIMKYVQGKIVMVTGGGGSIGAELCRQLVEYNPKCLIIFDIYENNAYEIQQELLISYPEVKVETLIGSVRNKSRLEDVFNQYRPDIVYHAAAHKHVPLMEVSPNEAIKNNVVGTWNLAAIADKYGVSKFVMISTDKAVNPTNVMGATKRICEMIIQAYNERSKTDYVAVRFGNVLGSNGSVIPLFKKQIEAGGPVTVTHPDIIRYFMTIPEATSLVLQAGAYAHGGEIFILDMGEPVKIDDLAKNLIRLSGYILGVDMEIKYTGLRPGEKLFEELLMSEEGLQSTKNKLIHIGKPIVFDKEKFFEQLNVLKDASYSETKDIKTLIKEVVSTYKLGNSEQ
ncbi:polysaccharide biosynthesis protein [[Clostridium] fimetarium]|uniref:NDP-sugar epimerase, includes UDP-GlcNAc-inverting 4,6-dehydratase FlaA1 and capsular polysaccharide biosynthesis protein EpsC n=1 Tax=[Clostridium] fimetarium TaxID=99656 RepID=A0A1I0MBF3_9FIRM|nr:nucleoside-diphosphate sugar epimerase/dehydratase [[Clostridium] fimetarium]SEV85693.1 NDP-sugar epimerase, includes UDP-GlcNAc-inverting 4,6-dehydratase FlaA1 and capsular polysaccharide biosynthesis protein EpsC [[Clostridium] fimetarium]